MHKYNISVVSATLHFIRLKRERQPVLSISGGNDKIHSCKQGRSCIANLFQYFNYQVYTHWRAEYYSREYGSNDRHQKKHGRSSHVHCSDAYWKCYTWSVCPTGNLLFITATKSFLTADPNVSSVVDWIWNSIKVLFKENFPRRFALKDSYSHLDAHTQIRQYTLHLIESCLKLFSINRPCLRPQATMELGRKTQRLEAT